MSCLVFCPHSRCGRCNKPWCQVEPHTTNYNYRHGCFPLCEGCWSALTPLERAPFYEALWRRWRDESPESTPMAEIEQILAAVKAVL